MISQLGIKDFITNYKIIKFNTLPINTNYLLIDTNILS